MFFRKKSKILGLLGFCWDSAGIYVPAAGILQVSQQNPSISIPARTGPLDGTSNSVLNCFPVKCAEPVIDKAVWFETLDSGKTSEYKRGVQKSKLIF